MPIRLSDLAKATRPASFNWEGETCNLEYRPSAITTQMQFAAASITMLGKDDPAPDDPDAQRARGVERAGALVEALGDYIDAMVKLLASWDVLGDDGAPLPIERETLTNLSLDFVYAMFGAIMAAYNPNPKRVRA